MRGHRERSVNYQLRRKASKEQHKLRVMPHACNLSAQERAERFIQGQPLNYIESFSLAWAI